MRKFQIVSLVVVSLVLLGSTAFAFGEIRYTDRPLNLRDGRSPQARWVGNMYPGQKVRIDHLKDGWVAVFEPDAVDGRESAAVGFANIKYLNKERTRYEPKEWGELQYASRAINVRSKPSVKGKKIMSLKSWEHVLVDFPEGDWIMVFKPNATIRSEMNGIGYSSAKYFRPATEKTMAGVGFKKNPEIEEVATEPEAVVEPEAVAPESLACGYRGSRVRRGTGQRSCGPASCRAGLCSAHAGAGHQEDQRARRPDFRRSPGSDLEARRSRQSGTAESRLVRNLRGV